MAVPFYVRGDKALKEGSDASAIAAEFENERNKLDAAFTAVQAAVVGVAPAYAAGTPADWATAAPTTVSEAIDRLATAVAGILAVPIP